MQSAEYLRILRSRAAALVVSARTSLEAPVPSCPGWTITDLITHVGSTWGWAAAIVQTGARAELPVPPEGTTGPALIAWAEDHAHRIFVALESADPDSECWTFGLPRSRLFWFRRQALETVVHAWDGQRAVGHAEPIEPETAGDGIDEFLSVMLPRQIQRNPSGWAGESIHLHQTDGVGEWMVRLGPDGFVTTESVHGKGDVALRGSASSLYLWCVGRLPTTELEVFGDRAVTDRWTSEVAF